jgi:hypothetical protein
MAVRDMPFEAPWGLLGFSALVGAASIGLGRRSLLGQVFSRGVAWVVLAPTLVGVMGALFYGRTPDGWTALFAATSGTALLLARPALHTESARSEFAPVAYRTWFLAGAVASVTAGVVAALAAAELLHWQGARTSLALAALSSALLVSALGVARMRSWGVLLGMLSSVITLASAFLVGGELGAIGLALAAIPGAVLAVPLVAARLRDPRATREAPLPSTEALVEERQDAAPSVLARIRVVAEPEGEELAEQRHLAVGQE